jgi:hypothetical protein
MTRMLSRLRNSRGSPLSFIRVTEQMNSSCKEIGDCCLWERDQKAKLGIFAG